MHPFCRTEGKKIMTCPCELQQLSMTKCKQFTTLHVLRHIWKTSCIDFLKKLILSETQMVQVIQLMHVIIHHKSYCLCITIHMYMIEIHINPSTSLSACIPSKHNLSLNDSKPLQHHETVFVYIRVCNLSFFHMKQKWPKRSDNFH